MSGEYVRLRIPIDEGLSDRLQAFWHSIFGDAPDIEPAVFLGSETGYNTSDLYLVEEDGRAISTTMVTTCNALPELGGVGEVATVPEARGRGLATELCRQAVEDFAEAGGRALFLGTVNPAAARIYHRVGWRKLASSIVWALITDDRPPEAYLVDYFSNPGPAVVEEGGPGARIPMIPLIVTPHDWRVLDANTGIFSARYALVRSCMGLYPKYQALREGGRGDWFEARDAQRRIVGLSTAVLDDSRECRVDGFTHGGSQEAWDDLLRAAIDWGKANDASVVYATACVEDEDRIARLEAMGFRGVGPAPDFDVDGQTVGAVRMEL